MTTATQTEGLSSSANGMSRELESYDVVVIGGGQAGLAAGYYLARR